MLRKAMVITLAGILSACATQEEVATTTEMGDPVVNAGEEMETLVRPNPGFSVEGEVAVRPTADGNTFLSIAVAEAEPGAVLPWHLHDGDCGDGGGIVGAASAYTPISIDANGEGQAEANIAHLVESGGDYNVNVHKSPSEMGTIVACGEVDPN